MSPQGLQRPLIIAHASIVLHNWTMIDPALGFQPDNLRMLASFGGSSDEEWFYMVTVAIEACGARVLPQLLLGKHAASSDDHDALQTVLHVIGETIRAMTSMLERMEERCRHDVFYHHIRPYLTGWPEPGVVYEGAVRHSAHPPWRQCRPVLRCSTQWMPGWTSHTTIQARVRSCRPCATTCLHGIGVSLDFWKPDLRSEMPPPNEATRIAFDRCIDRLTHFRRTHQAITMRYITQRAPTTHEATGTGGADYADFLRRTRLETSDRKTGRLMTRHVHFIPLLLALPAVGEFTIEPHATGRSMIREDGRPYWSTTGRPMSSVPEHRTRSCYIHPLHGLDGEVLTDDFPQDHLHHRGVSMMWPGMKVGARKVDHWHIDGIRTINREVQFVDADAGAELTVLNDWMLDDGTDVADEQTRITIAPAGDSSRIIDVASKITAGPEPITLRGAALPGLRRP